MTKLCIFLTGQVRIMYWVCGLCMGIACFSGCADRRIWINSDPPGAKIYLDGESRGLTPAVIPFVYYGGREIVLEKEGYQPIRKTESIKPPFLHIFPFDLFLVFLPYPSITEYSFSYKLQKPEKTDVQKVWNDALELKTYLRKKLAAIPNAKPPTPSKAEK
jgi:hypothetical protein